jgi:hypothetical protein
VTEPLRLFCGHDDREAIGYAVFCHSVVEHASIPVSFTPLSSMGMPVGSNAFTLSRFLAPYLCGYQGMAIFMDASDMLMTADIAELAALYDPSKSVQVVKHPDYKTRHPVKYIGTEMECPNIDYPRKNWASVMILNCAHHVWAGVSPETLGDLDRLKMLQLARAEGNIGELPAEWNRLVDEGQPYGKVLHWTAGLPAFTHYADAPFAGEWREARARALRG